MCSSDLHPGWAGKGEPQALAVLALQENQNPKLGLRAQGLGASPGLAPPSSHPDCQRDFLQPSSFTPTLHGQ